MEIVPNIHQFSLLSANVFLIIEKKGLTLVDTAMHSSTNKIVRFIQDLGHNPADLKQILITHTDMDHVGGAKALKELSRAKIYASESGARAMAEGKPPRELKLGKIGGFLFSLMLKSSRQSKLEIDEILAPGQKLSILGGLEVIDTAGHTPCHLSFYAKKPGILFAGDSLRSRTDKLLFNLSPVITWDREKSINAVKRQAELKPKFVCTGHGPVVNRAKRKFPTINSD